MKRNTACFPNSLIDTRCHFNTLNFRNKRNQGCYFADTMHQNFYLSGKNTVFRLDMNNPDIYRIFGYNLRNLIKHPHRINSLDTDNRGKRIAALVCPVGINDPFAETAL